MIISSRPACALAAVVLSLVGCAQSLGQCFGDATPVPPGAGPVSQAWFGYSVSMRGGIAVVGQPFGLPNQAAHVYEWNGAGWEFVTRLLDPAPIAGFTGTAVDTDGERVIVGVGLLANGAAAMIFRRENGLYVFEARLTPPDLGAGGDYGFAVAIDGDLAALGRRSLQGGVDVYRRTGGAWVLVQSLESDFPEAQSEFGESVDLSAGHLVVGSPGDTYVQEIGPVGAVYVYARTLTGVQFQQRLTSPAQPVGLGRSVAIDGSTIVAGSGNETGNIEDSYVFALEGGVWSQQAVLQAPDQSEFDNFGSDVAVSGNFIAVGASRDDPHGADSGAVYLYRRSGAQWSPFLDVFAPGGAAGDAFGFSVALDAGRMIVSAPTADTQMLDSSGLVFAYSSAALSGSVAPLDQSVAFGASAAVTASATGVPPLTYQWVIGGVKVPEGLPPYAGAATDTLQIENATATFDEMISVEISDGCGFVTTLGPASVHVAPLTSSCEGDANGDGHVLFNDITAVLTNFGMACP